jgi:hypothetical protein
MSIRKVGLALAVVCASLLVVPVAAGAATPTRQSVKSLSSIRISGVARNHKQFTGRFNVDRFVTRSNGKTYAVGTLTGKLGKRQFTRSNVAFPVHLVGNSPAADRAAPRAIPAGCTIVHLVISPIQLNVLGLVVTLGGGANANRPIVLDITAVPGSGNLLGNLLCNVANLLNPPSAAGTRLAGLLNLFNTLLNNPILGTLSAPVTTTTPVTP